MKGLKCEDGAILQIATWLSLCFVYVESGLGAKEEVKAVTKI